ncbi:MotA/TolQ/ExbB proton channel family protein [uncultured Methanobrevibacter sp.]|uniref:MotA/TolQ/ExbB proton channel family protein n=1 Tax=uncultured Methanobrevibacter sp. TaxID=253161 RepID=UPI00261A2CAD
MVYGDLITGSMDIISQSLSIPVLLILLVFVAISVIVLGSLVREYFSRDKVGVNAVGDLIFNVNKCPDDLSGVISSSAISSRHKALLLKIADSGSLKRTSREAYARKLVESEEKRINKTLRVTDIITRIGPTLGLMGTLIPMGPGLAALGAGDINTLASSLTVAFNTTIIGIGSGALCYVIGKIRLSWYSDDLANLDVLTDAVLDVMD